MSKSFAINNGDLVLDARSFAVVKGQNKLFQDLRLTIEEPLGTDSLAPLYGSSLDREIVNGQEISPFIGQTISPIIISNIVGEVRRVLQTYQQNQLQKMKDEGLQFQGRTTLDDSEIIYSIDNIDAMNNGTVVIVKAALTTMAGITANLTFPVNV